MNKIELCALLVLSVICLSTAMEHKCMEKATPEEKKAAMETMETCKKKLGITEMPKLEELEKNGFDDKCLAKCLLTEKKMLTDKNEVDMKSVEEFLKKVPADKQADIKKLWESCGDSTKKAMEAEGGVTDKNACKAAAMLKHCFMKGVHKVSLVQKFAEAAAKLRLN